MKRSCCDTSYKQFLLLRLPQQPQSKRPPTQPQKVHFMQTALHAWRALALASGQKHHCCQQRHEALATILPAAAEHTAALWTSRYIKNGVPLLLVAPQRTVCSHQ
jgi:hypothetical protein